MFEAVVKLKEFVDAVNKVITLMRTDEDFQSKFKTLLQLARSPFIQNILGGSVDIDQVEVLVKSMLTDDVSLPFEPQKPKI